MQLTAEIAAPAAVHGVTGRPTPTSDRPAPEDAVVVAVMAVGRLMKARIIDGVEPGTHALLYTLRSAGAQRVTDLAATCRLDTSTMSRHVRGLERHGLVARTPDPDDGRAQVVDLTAAGGEALDLATRARRQLLAELLADWPRDDVDTLARLLTNLAAGAEARSRELESASPRAESA